MIISVYSNAGGHSKREYAVNLAAALFRIAKTGVAFLGAEPTINPETGIDFLNLSRIRSRDLKQIKEDYRYIIIDLPVNIDESVYEIFSYSDIIHLFVDSTKDNLKKSYDFLEDLLRKGLEDIHNKIKIVVNRLNIFDKFLVEEMSWLVRREVWAVVPEPGILDAPIDAKGIPLVVKSEGSSYSKAIMRIAKSEAGKLLGLALGSGAAFGLAHIGVLKILEKNNIQVDILSGSSIGALIAAMRGLGYSADKMEKIAEKLKNKLNIMRLLDFAIPISGILAGKRLRRFLKKIFGEKTFEDLQIPVKIVIYDLANRETIVIEKGLLLEAAYMSISVPGIFEPTIKRERMIVDGGISDPLPVDILVRQGAKKIIAVNVLPGPEDIYKRNMALRKRLDGEENMMRTSPFYIKFGIIIRRFFRKVFTPNIFDVIMTSMQSMEYELAENSCRRADIVLRPVLAEATSIDFHLAKSFIKRAEEETLQHIEKIKELVFK